MRSALLGAGMALLASSALAEECFRVLIYEVGDRRNAAELELIYQDRLEGMGAVLELALEETEIRVHLPRGKEVEVVELLAKEYPLYLAIPGDPTEEGGAPTVGEPLTGPLRLSSAFSVNLDDYYVVVRVHRESAGEVIEAINGRLGEDVAIVRGDEVVSVFYPEEPRQDADLMLFGDLDLNSAFLLSVQVRTGHVPPTLGTPRLEWSERQDCGETG